MSPDFDFELFGVFGIGHRPSRLAALRAVLLVFRQLDELFHGRQMNSRAGGAGLLPATTSRLGRLLRVLQLVRAVSATGPFRLATEEFVSQLPGFAACRLEFLNEFCFPLDSPGMHRLPVPRQLFQFSVFSAQFRVFLTPLKEFFTGPCEDLFRQGHPLADLVPWLAHSQGRTHRNIAGQHAIHDLRAIPRKPRSRQGRFPENQLQHSPSGGGRWFGKTLTVRAWVDLPILRFRRRSPDLAKTADRRSPRFLRPLGYAKCEAATPSHSKDDRPQTTDR